MIPGRFPSEYAVESVQHNVTGEVDYLCVPYLGFIIFAMLVR